MQMGRRIYYIMVLFLLGGCNDQFTWFPEPLPEVIELSPTNGTAGTTVTISGHAFGNIPQQNSVYFNEVKATIVSSEDTKLEVIAPASTTGPVIIIIKGRTAANKPVFVYD